MKKILIVTAALLTLCNVQRSAAQIPNQGLATLITMAQKANATLLKTYSWSSRTEFIDHGKVGLERFLPPARLIPESSIL